MKIAEINNAHKKTPMDDKSMVENTQGLIDKSQLLDNPEPPKVNEMDVGDIVGEKYKRETLADLKLMAIDEKIITEFLTKLIGQTPAPQHVGLWMKLLDERRNNRNG